MSATKTTSIVFDNSDAGTTIQLFLAPPYAIPGNVMVAVIPPGASGQPGPAAVTIAAALTAKGSALTPTQVVQALRDLRDGVYLATGYTLA